MIARPFNSFGRSSQNRCRALLIALVLTGATGCRGDGQISPDREDASEPAAYLLSEVPLVRIGGHDDRPAYQLQYPVGAVPLSDGRIVIADAGFRELRYFDEEGRHLRTVGGSGQGPGEFSSLRGPTRIRGDTIVAWDPVSRRASFFGDGADFARVVTVDGWMPIQEQLEARHPGNLIGFTPHFLNDGGMIVEPSVTPFLPTEEAQVFQDTVPLFAFDRNGDFVAELPGAFPATELYMANGSGGLLRFGERLIVAAAKDSVYVGSSRDRVVRVFSPTGEVARVISLPMKRREVTPDDVPAMRPGGPVSGPGGRVNALLSLMPVLDSMPVFSGIRPGDDGRLWVQKYRAPEDRSQEWLAFDETGNVVASLIMNASIELLDIGLDYVIVSVTDELDVPEIQMHRLGASSG
jgi:hypothetical protein